MSIYVRNNTASTIARGQAVYSDGVAGGLPRVALAKANAVATMPCIGIALEPIDPSQDGRVGTSETVTGMDTSAFTLGDLLYVSAATAGALTATVPASPNIVQRVGRVTFVSARDGRLSLNLEPALFSADGAFEISGATPELRFKETDQTAPAGEYRWQGAADQFLVQRALTAGYATVINFLKFDYSGSVRRMIADEALRVHWDNLGIQIWHNDGVIYTVDSNGNGSAYYFGANNSSTVHTSVAKVANATDPGGTNNPFWQFINRPVYFDVDMYGPAGADWNIIAGPVATGTPRNMKFQVISDTGNAFVLALQLSPNNADPIPALRAPNITPTTTLLPATFLGFVIDGSDQLVAYFNKAGAIISRNLGVLA